ncbi:MAG: hypothetical protein OEV68_18610, partial [candidate division Zixibacteria bacterium]|nr:hypothetical protein [candidate division Zixibacteria bacterium]
LSADVFELHQRLLVKKEPHLRWYIASRLAGLPREVFNTAGGVHRVRQVARLALFQHLNDPEAVIRQRLQSAIEFLSEFLLDGKTAQVFIVGSSSGGTGSAIAHDLAYLIRRGLQLRLPKGREHAQTIGFFLGNTCFAPHSRNIATYQKNSRSLLEEAGRFMTNTELPLMIDYGTAVSDITGCPEGTGPVASDSTENAASAPGSIYDQVYVVDPAPEGYRDSAGMTGTVVAEDGHYPALADILSHYSLEDTGFQKFIAKSIWERNADRTVKEQKGHISNINARAVRFPIGLTSTWLAHRFVHEWFIGRSLWAEQIAGEFVPAQDLPKDGLSLDSLLRDDNLGPSSDPPMLFDILDELAEDLRSGWDRNWSTAFRRIQVNEGVDYGRDYVRKQSKIAFFSVLSWMLRSLNDSGHDDSQEINGALPKTINRLTEFRDLTEKAALNLSRLPIGNLTETGAESFLHWKARIVEELLDSYYQVADTCLRITRRWYRCLLGVSPENEKNREAGVCQRIAHSLRSDENDLSFLKTIRSVKYQTDELFRDDLYNRYLKPYLDNGGFRSRLRWQLDALALKQLSAGMSSGAGSFGTDRINARILKLAVLVDDEQPPVEFSDPVKDAEGICQALSDVAKKLNQAYEYCRAFADNGADDRREHLSRTDLIIQATPEGGATFDRKRLVLDSEVFKDVVVDAIADRFPLYPMPMCRTVIDCEIGIPIDRAVSWATEAIPDIANYVFLEEQFSTVLQGLIDSQLHERFDDFSVRLRQYFNYFDR